MVIIKELGSLDKETYTIDADNVRLICKKALRKENTCNICKYENSLKQGNSICMFCRLVNKIYNSCGTNMWYPTKDSIQLFNKSNLPVELKKMKE